MGPAPKRACDNQVVDSYRLFLCHTGLAQTLLIFVGQRDLGSRRLIKARGRAKIKPIGRYQGIDMNRLKSKLATLLCAATMAGAAQAATVNVAFSNGSLFDTTAIDTFTVGAVNMVGVGVTACFTVDPCQTLAWGVLGADTGGVVGTGWRLGMTGLDSFNSRFVLEVSLANSSLVSLSINGRPGLTAFDVVADGNGSPGSAIGKPFDLVTPDTSVTNISVLYTDKLSVGGVFYDDLYTVMNLNFNGGNGFRSGRLEFVADTDKTLNGAPITPGTPVPTPGTLALVGLGLLAAAAKTRHKTQS
jgi:hypothetical protein